VNGMVSGWRHLCNKARFDYKNYNKCASFGQTTITGDYLLPVEFAVLSFNEFRLIFLHFRKKPSLIETQEYTLESPALVLDRLRRGAAVLAFGSVIVVAQVVGQLTKARVSC